MGILEMFNPAGEQKAMEDAERRSMQFQKEQNAVAVAVPEEQTEIINQEGKSDLLKWQQDLDPELETITFRLTGWTKRDGEWVKTNKIPLCNDLFMQDVIAPQLEPFLTKNLINSNLSEERILKNLKHTANDITANMCDGYDCYGIDFKNYDLILRVLKNTMKNSAFRALNGWTKKTDSTIFKKLESSFDNANQPQQKGLLGFKK